MRTIPPLVPYNPVKRRMINRAEIRRYAKYVAGQWGVPAKRVSKKFLADAEEGCRRVVTQLVVANGQHGRKTLK